MNAHAMVGPYTLNFDTAAMANEINKHDFANLPIDRFGDIILGPDQALYMYGGRKSLITALNQFHNLRIISDKWVRVALFRARRKVAGGTKTKQLLMIAQVPNGIPAGVQPYPIQVNDYGNFRGQALITTIQNLSK